MLLRGTIWRSQNPCCELTRKSIAPVMRYFAGIWRIRDAALTARTFFSWPRHSNGLATTPRTWQRKYSTSCKDTACVTKRGEEVMVDVDREISLSAAGMRSHFEKIKGELGIAVFASPQIERSGCDLVYEWLG